MTDVTNVTHVHHDFTNRYEEQDRKRYTLCPNERARYIVGVFLNKKLHHRQRQETTGTGTDLRRDGLSGYPHREAERLVRVFL